MRVEIAKLHRDLGSTMIYVTHDQVEAMTMADKIVVLRAGEVEQVGSPLELYNRPANRFVAGFIGSPKMNFLNIGSAESRVLAGSAVSVVTSRRSARSRQPAIAGPPPCSASGPSTSDWPRRRQSSAAPACSSSSISAARPSSMPTLQDGQPVTLEIEGQKRVPSGRGDGFLRRSAALSFFDDGGRSLAAS